MRKNKGITLIALVITIIVLLILAGVSIATLTGENGILTKATEAKEKNNLANLKDMVQTEMLGYQLENNGGNVTIEQYRIVLNKYFEKVPEASELEESLKNPDYSLKAKEEYGGYDVKIADIYQGAIKEKNIETANTLKNKLDGTNGKKSVIGKEVTGLELAEGLEGKKEYGWKIFDVVDENIYLIAKDYIKTVDCPDKGGDNHIVSYGEYKLAMNYVINDYPKGSEDIVDKEMQKLNFDFFGEDGTKNTSTDENMKTVAYMLDREIWTSKFIGNKDGNDKVKYVIASPTIEQMFSSYNKKYGTNKSAKVYKKELGAASTGYKVSNSEAADANYLIRYK